MKRSFVILSEAWYADANLRNATFVDEIMIQVGDSGFSFKWYRISREIAPRIEAFDDSWRALSGCRDLLDKMAEADNKNITPNAFAEILIGLGFDDATPREIPAYLANKTA